MKTIKAKLTEVTAGSGRRPIYTVDCPYEGGKPISAHGCTDYYCTANRGVYKLLDGKDSVKEWSIFCAYDEIA